MFLKQFIPIITLLLKFSELNYVVQAGNFKPKTKAKYPYHKKIWLGNWKKKKKRDSIEIADRKPQTEQFTQNVPSGVEDSFLRLEGGASKLMGVGWCSGERTMADMMICCLAVAGVDG